MMPVQCTLGALSTFKFDPGVAEGFVTLFTDTLFPSIILTRMDSPVSVNGNKISIVACSSSETQLINLNGNNNIPNVAFVSRYKDANTSSDYNFGSINLDISDNITLITGENINFSGNNVDGVVIRKIQSNNTLLSSYANPPDSGNVNAGIIISSQVIGSNGNIILGMYQTLPDLIPNVQPIVKSFSSDGSLINWTKYFTISSTRLQTYTTDFSSNLISCITATRVSNGISFFDLSENGNTISNIVTLQAGTTANVVSDIVTMKYDSNLDKIGIIRNSAASTVALIKFLGNTIDYQIQGNLNNSAMIFNGLFISNNNFYTIAYDTANNVIDPKFINVACFDTTTGTNKWQKNIRVSDANTTYNLPMSITVENNNVYITGELYKTISNVATVRGTFIVKLPDTGDTLYNYYNLGNSGYSITIKPGNAVFANSSLGNVNSSANIALNNANIVNTFSITNSTNTSQAWNYVSSAI